MQKIQALHVITTEALVAPRLLKEQLAINDRIARTVVEARQTVRRIIRGEDSRLMCIVGPCSIHDPAAALTSPGALPRLRPRFWGRLFSRVPLTSKNPPPPPDGKACQTPPTHAH